MRATATHTGDCVQEELRLHTGFVAYSIEGCGCIGINQGVGSLAEPT